MGEEQWGSGGVTDFFVHCKLQCFFLIVKGSIEVHCENANHWTLDVELSSERTPGI